MDPEELELRSEVVARGRHEAAVADATEILRRIEAEAADVAEAAGAASVPGGEDRLGGVLDHRDAGAVGDRHERIDVGGAAEEMNGDDRLRAPADLPLHVGRADEVGVGIDVGEDRHGAETRHGAGRREEGVARQDHLIAGLDVEGHQGEEEAVGAGGAADGVRHAQQPRQFGLEIGDVGAEDEPA